MNAAEVAEVPQKMEAASKKHQGLVSRKAKAGI